VSLSTKASFSAAVHAGASSRVGCCLFLRAGGAYRFEVIPRRAERPWAYRLVQCSNLKGQRE
jgi:hypothetical protein